jgi:hypothetical protein
LLANGQPRIANLANEVVPAGEQLNDLVLTNPDFPQPILNFWCRAKLLNSDGDPRFDSAQRTNLALGFFPVTRLDCV